MKKLLLLLLFTSVIMTGCLGKKTSEVISTPTYTEEERTLWSSWITAYPNLVDGDGGTVNVTSSTVNENTLNFTFSCTESYDEMFAGSSYTFEMEKTNGTYYLNVYVNDNLIAIKSASSIQDIIDGNVTEEYETFTTAEQDEFEYAILVENGDLVEDTWNNIGDATVNVQSKELYAKLICDTTVAGTVFVSGQNYEVKFVKVAGVYYIKEYVGGVYKYLGKGSSVTQLLGNAPEPDYAHTLVDGEETF